MRQAPLEVHKTFDLIDRVPYRIPRALDRLYDRSSYRVPGRGCYAPDAVPCIGEEVLGVGQHRDHHSLHRIQDIRDICPKEGKEYVQDVLHRK